MSSRGVLGEFGWTEELERDFEEFGRRGFVPGRVVVGYGPWMRVVTEAGEITAMLPGRMRLKGGGAGELPVVGDWIALRNVQNVREYEGAEAGVARAGVVEEASDGGGVDVGGASFDEGPGDGDEPLAVPEAVRRTIDPPSAIVEMVLPRRSRLARKAPGTPTVQQVLAANVDYAWLVTALGPDFNPRRLERYLGLAREGRTTPVVVMNKADLVSAKKAGIASEMLAEVAGEDVAIHLVSSKTGQGLEEMRRYLEIGKTIVLLGSSGVGKSTIVNRLAGAELMDTNEVRGDGRGRHTTTRRELRQMPGGGLLIDTPGIREIQVWEELRGVEETFPEIEELALECRFSNCSHGGEPGCAVAAAIEEGRVPEERLESWNKLRAEAHALEAQRDTRAKAEKKRQERMGSKAMKPFKKR